MYTFQLPKLTKRTEPLTSNLINNYNTVIAEIYEEGGVVVIDIV